MVYARTGVGHILGLSADPFSQHLRRSLNAVAQAGHFHPGVGLHGLAKHAHGVGVVQEYRFWAVFFDVAADVQHQRNIAQGPENAGHAAGVAHIDVHTVFLGNFNVVAPDVDVAVEHGADHAVRAFQRLRPVHGGGYRRLIAEGGVDFVHACGDFFQPQGIDVHQSNVAILKGRKGKQIPNQIAGKDVAARADESEFFHENIAPFQVVPAGSFIIAGGRKRSDSISCEYMENIAAILDIVFAFFYS